MHRLLVTSAAIGALALGFVVSGVAAAPLLGATTTPSVAASSVEPVFFFRCGLFGQRCRDDRRRYYRDRRYYRR